MNRPETLTPAHIAQIVERLRADKPIRRAMPGWGRLHIDRQLPFIVVYRRPEGRDDAGSERLVVGSASYLLATGARERTGELRELLKAVAGALRAAFGAVLVMEVWTGGAGADDRPDMPAYRVCRRSGDALGETAEELASALRESRIRGESPGVRIEACRAIAPKGHRQLLTARELESLGARLLGLEVRPVFRADSGEPYPVLLRQVSGRVAMSLDRAAYRFSHTHTTERPAHYHVLGRRAVVKAVWEIDHALAQIGESFDPLLLVTPVNAEHAWAAFRRRRYARPPRFQYRPLEHDPARLKHRLWAIRTERVEDPTLMYLFRDTQRALDRQLTLVGDIGKPEFINTSLQVYGGVEPGLLGLAEHLLATLPRRSRRRSERLDASAFAALGTAEILGYRKEQPGFGFLPQVREDLYAGIITSNGRVFVGSEASVPRSRADALIQHEIGTHVVTHFNGGQQPLRLLAVGLPGYDELQEGLAVLAEHLVGGLDAERMRVLAARVVAVGALTDGADFVETFRLLRGHGFTQRAAFTITVRVYRGGGLTKDAMYLRGLAGILDHVAEGGDYAQLFCGKFGVKHVPIVDELLLRKVLSPAVVLPRYLERPAAQRRLDRIAGGLSVMDLLKGERSV